jgi:hypothetical protein
MRLVANANCSAPATSTFARWRSDLTELRRQMASVVGLAPTRLGLKGRLLELLCIHGQRWSLRSVLRRRLLVFSEALICLSYSGKWLAKPKLRERRLVVPRGNAPRSFAYQARALLLSYRTWRKASVSRRPRLCADPVFETGAASLYLPAFHELVRVARFALASSSFRTRPSAADITP